MLRTFYYSFIFCFLFIESMTAQNNPVKIIQNGDVLTSYQGQIISRDNVVGTISNQDKIPPVTYETNTVSFVTYELNINARTVYDLQSNGCIRYIWQCPSNFLQMYAIFTVSNDPAAWPDRNVRCFYTSNGGTSWDYLGLVSNSRAGFGALSGLDNCRGIIACHTANAPSGNVRTQVFVDLAPGAGTWTARDPGVVGTDIPIWPSVISTIDNGALITASVNATNGALYRNKSSNLTIFPVTWNGWVEIPNGQAGALTGLARSGKKLGIAYLTRDMGISYLQSTDNGVTWDSPIVVRAYNPADSTGTLRSIDMVFQNGQPKVIFGVCHIITGGFFPSLPSFIYTWSPNINGGNPVLVDSSRGLIGSGEVDVFTSVARGVIGTSTNGVALYAAWCRARLSDTSASGVHFFDVWFAYSSNGGATWLEKTRLTNISGPLKDNRYVSISPTNNSVGSTYYVYLVHQQDSIAGTYVNMGPLSTSYMMFTKVKLVNDPVGIKQIGSEIPNSYSLSQNYPNPFNPSTKIRFQISTSPRPIGHPSPVRRGDGGEVKLSVYDVLGREVATLVNEQLKPGTYEVDFDGSNFASGLYYYKLVATDYTETKKMVIVK